MSNIHPTSTVIFFLLVEGLLVIIPGSRIGFLNVKFMETGQGGMAVHPTRWRIHLHALSDPPPNLVGKRKHNKWAAWELYLVGDVGDPVYSDIEFCCLQVCYVVIPDRVLPREGRDAAIHDHPMIIVSTLSTAVGAECERDAAPLLFFFLSLCSSLLFSFLF